jgi:hypothetical protein
MDFFGDFSSRNILAILCYTFAFWRPLFYRLLKLLSETYFILLKTSYLTRLEQGTFVGKNPDNQNSINGQTDGLQNSQCYLSV